jgi:2-isopropylmalate synthase
VDLRDGNQALIEPMDPQRKRRMFDLMLRIGLKEIEVGYPAASESDFEFVRQLIEEKAIPEDVTIVVLTPARSELIERTFEAIAGASSAMIHLYNATAPLWRETVFGLDVAGVRALAVEATLEIVKRVRAHNRRHEVTKTELRKFEVASASSIDSTTDVDPRINAAMREGWRSEAEVLEQQLREYERIQPLRLEYSPEAFSMTERDVAVDICNAVIASWQPTSQRPITINLPATIEAAAPNVYADQIEYAHRHLHERAAVILSAHPHNDRGTGVAAAEFALMAGAQRLEGCLLGNGERTGNVCLITLALNLYTQGVDPELDLSDIDSIRRTVEYCNRLPVHPRHPYVGELVYTSFAGTHQDAINKAFAARETRSRESGIPVADLPWEMPYLPMDPVDVGRSYEAVIRVNSQSGKGGIAYLMETDYGLQLPRPLQIELARTVQAQADTEGGEITSEALWDIFTREFMRDDAAATQLISSRFEQRGEGEHLTAAVLDIEGQRREIEGVGAGPLDAFAAALAAIGYELSIDDYHEHALGAGADARAAAYVNVSTEHGSAWGVGIDPSIMTASFKAVLAALDRLRV